MKWLVVFFSLMSTVSAFANNGYSTRYTVTYNTWDNGFNQYYSYSERIDNPSCRNYTCYDFNSNDNVYVEETIIENGTYSGYTRTTVYRSSRYSQSDRYATYYTYGGQVIRRDYYETHRYVARPSYVDYRYSNVNYSYIDDTSAEILVGAAAIGVGAAVLSSCAPDDQACLVIGLASSVSGSALSLSASARAERRSDFQRHLEEHEKSSHNLDLENSRY
jgi:hypothetical protein